MSEPTKKLTKKEKKAQAFRQQKGKKPSISATPFTDEDAVPISEDINQPEDEREPPVVADKEKGKKRKRTEIDEGEEDKVEGQGEEEVPKKKKRQRGKKKSQQVRPGVDEEGKPRLIVFVGTPLCFFLSSVFYVLLIEGRFVYRQSTLQDYIRRNRKTFRTLR